jgi:tRNA threonylcarbamoyladenosine biosynthesis protein TsaB
MPLRILALDTATEACSVALWCAGEMYTLSDICPRQHTERILPQVQQVLAQASVTLNQLDALAFGRGPGSFTGVRIAAGIIQGLALGADLPVMGISTLQTMAQGAWRLTQAKRVLAAIDARMGEVYWGQFERTDEGVWQDEKERLLTPVQALSQLSLLQGTWAYVGSGWQAYPYLITESAVTFSDGQIRFPDAQDMLPLALQMWSRGEAVSAENAEPVYLRNDVAVKKRPDL